MADAENEADVGVVVHGPNDAQEHGRSTAVRDPVDQVLSEVCLRLGLLNVDDGRLQWCDIVYHCWRHPRRTMLHRAYVQTQADRPYAGPGT